MKEIELMEYIKRSKDRKCTKDCFVRFKVKRLEDGRLLLFRNVMSRKLNSGELSMGVVLDKTGKPISTSDSTVGIVSLDDVEQMLNGCLVELLAPDVNLGMLEPSRWLDINLGVSNLEYQKVTKEDAKEFYFPTDSLSIEYLRTDDSYRKMRFARRLVSEADKIAQLNGLGYLCGLGVPFDKDFYIVNKTLNDFGVSLQFEKYCKKRNIQFEPMGAIVNLAIFYSRLGFEIYPIESGHFLIQKKAGDINPTKQDEAFLKAKKSVLDQSSILFER